MVEETRKIFHLPELKIVATCVRVPVLRAHSEAVVAEFERELDASLALEVLSNARGIKVVDDVEGGVFPMPLDASGQLELLVGRLRNEPGDRKTLAFFISGDQLLKGAAWNAVQIAECLIATSCSCSTCESCG